jgi:hypothetical protein
LNTAGFCIHNTWGFGPIQTETARGGGNRPEPYTTRERVLLMAAKKKYNNPAAQARKEQMRYLCKQISQMSNEQRAEMAARMAGVVTVEGRALSVFNTCMIYNQCETATMVGGYRQWKANGRQVRKGEHGLAIWIPVRSKKKDAEDAEKTPESDEDDRPNFILGTVFDISQTDEIAATEPAQTELSLAS